MLAAVVTNLLQNAFKFTRPQSAVTLRVGASAERVLNEIEDECGGLPDGNTDDLFRPFEQRGLNRTGLGLGLAFSRWGVEANQGQNLCQESPWPRLHLYRGSAASLRCGRLNPSARAG